MMGDGTEEQNLNQKGDPSARITEAEVKDAFEKGSDAVLAVALGDPNTRRAVHGGAAAWLTFEAGPRQISVAER